MMINFSIDVGSAYFGLIVGAVMAMIIVFLNDR